jgi:Fe2+ transport system protein FeoA
MTTVPTLSSAPVPTVSKSPPGMQLVRLNTLSPGYCGMVNRIDSPDADSERLKAMGVCIGRKVEVLKPGDPLIIRVLGSRLGLSARLAKEVHVEVCDAPGCTPANKT